MDIVKESEHVYAIAPTGKMRVPVRIFASEELLRKMLEDQSLAQACNVAALPGIVGASIVMPDAHQGYGMSVGGVAAFDAHDGIISPAAVGYDINCGVRLLATGLRREDATARMGELLAALAKSCPVGVGGEGIRLSEAEFTRVMAEGAHWALAHGYGDADDLARCEANGRLPGADPAAVPKRATQRGRNQLGTVGAGNHFIELQAVDEIYLPDVARSFGISGPGQLVAMIHCGSRGFGHQICTEYIKRIEDTLPEIARSLPDRDLMYAPIGSDVARSYWGAMNAAANFAFCNRHILGHQVRLALQEVFGERAQARTVYDVCHNIAKRETHLVGGAMRELIVHRKGATRALPAGSGDVPEAYRDVGQPVLIPGSMGTASYVLVGAQGSLERTFGSTAHGAGRLMSRTRAKQEFPSADVEAGLAARGITVKAASRNGVSEEAPGAYKDVDEVVEVSDAAGIARKVARLVPVGVLKG